MLGQKDVDLKILSNLDDKDLLNFCVSDPKNEYVKKLCSNEDFWRNRLLTNFPDFRKINKERSWKDTYLALIYYLSKYKEVRQRLIRMSKKGMKNLDLIEYTILKDDEISLKVKAKYGMHGAANGGHKDLIDYFISKGADDWNAGLRGAAGGNHKDLVEFFISKGADDFDDTAEIFANTEEMKIFLKEAKEKLI
jgi:hypothetical protein